ncbi:MFS transporter [Opitutus sp. GAS368]|jgi:FHS family glucose/mannose:H+ symporter-like MFS transporter|uniref:MFS transporter n=1 Tax=Opitutus sp. GAS368 TaxID=1882749 RepID=UPI0008794A34|nr:MFS transporter [Opitutus sp. GAS368]SDR99653.1 Fucose permease [Opitutus sp. GAS368]
MKHFRLKLSLFLNYFLFASLLNSVGTVILQVQRNFGVTSTAASVLEACKDLSIAVASFFVAAWLLRIGYKRAMLGALAFIGVVCALVPSAPSFMATQLLFVATGVCFGVMKVSVFSTLGLIAREQHEHTSLMSFLESCFMLGILSAYFLFSAFVDDVSPASTDWFRVYYVLAGIAAVAFLMLWSVPLDETEAHNPADAASAGGIGDMLRLALTPLVLVFVVGVFIYVLTEQAIMSWLPTFNNHVLHLPPTLSIQMASILAASTALGRFAAGWALRRLPWLAVLGVCLVAAAVLVILALPLAAAASARGVPITGWRDAPLGAFVFPIIGLFLAPIYPTLNSVVLSALPPARHGAMSGLIVVFSALGGTAGSLITGRLFQHYGGQTAFYLSLIPLTALAVCLAVIWRMQRGRTAGQH